MPGQLSAKLNDDVCLPVIGVGICFLDPTPITGYALIGASAVLFSRWAWHRVQELEPLP